MIAIGGSLGALDALRSLWASLPGDLAASLFVVVHVGSAGNNFIGDILSSSGAIRATTAVDGEAIERGRAYVAPADHHLLVMDGVLRLGRGPRENMARPALDPLFRSVGASYGPRAIAVVLTGLLDDGAAGLVDLKRCGGIAVVQSPADAAAPDMPLEALRTCDVDYRASIADMASVLVRLSAEDAGPRVDVPADILAEIDIALGRQADSAVVAQLADPVPISCPACGGVLSQVKRQPPLRFRCQVGHAYTAESLSAAQEGSIDEALRVALKILEERAVLTRKLAEDALRSGRHAAGRLYEKRAVESRASADVLRRAIGEV
jgi:two-component system chemotaxis response regulator CheB